MKRITLTIISLLLLVVFSAEGLRESQAATDTVLVTATVLPSGTLRNKGEFDDGTTYDYYWDREPGSEVYHEIIRGKGKDGTEFTIKDYPHGLRLILRFADGGMVNILDIDRNGLIEEDSGDRYEVRKEIKICLTFTKEGVEVDKITRSNFFAQANQTFNVWRLFRDKLRKQVWQEEAVKKAGEAAEEEGR